MAIAGNVEVGQVAFVGECMWHKRDETNAPLLAERPHLPVELIVGTST